MNATGGVVAGDIRLDFQLTDIETDPSVTILDNDFIVVSWTDPSSAGDILGVVYDSSGNVVSVGALDFIVFTATGSADTNSALGTIGSGDFAYAWQDSFSDIDGDKVSGGVASIVREIIAMARMNNSLGTNYVTKFSVKWE